ncbi:MAG TPA: hypothetical protein VNM67_16920 [Thermoanaerobaculia bacterium]|jgi:hypothetical protein|nr:hypothetical protein [Thermoanaerobaculia bacterium]
MSFKVKDLMINVGPLQDEADMSTCTHWTRTTGGVGCVDSVFDHAQRARHELSLLKAQLRQSATRA